MTVSQEGLNATAAPERYVGQLPGFFPTEDRTEPEHRITALDSTATVALSLDGLTEPVFPPVAWLEAAGAALAEHPLLRGLLLELPAKDTPPSAEWLNRWFEAARSILELIYVQRR
jgi:hypothetical protein